MSDEKPEEEFYKLMAEEYAKDVTRHYEHNDPDLLLEFRRLAKQSWLAGHEAAQNEIWAALTDFPDGEYHNVIQVYTSTLHNIIFNTLKLADEQKGEK